MSNIPVASDTEKVPVTSPLAKDLFGGTEQLSTEEAWSSTALSALQSEVCKGLDDIRRPLLLSKYEDKDGILHLGPPKINKELLPALKASTSILKRDEFQTQLQTQVAACLNALGQAVSTLLHLENITSLDCAEEEAIMKIAEAIHLLADLQYLLFLQRRAFIKPSLSLIGKSTSDTLHLDEWLFGSAFAENLKAAQACEKVARDLSKQLPKKNTQQLVRRQPLQQLQVTNRFSGNSKTPVRRRDTPARRSGANYQQSRSKRSSSRYRSTRR